MRKHIKAHKKARKERARQLERELHELRARPPTRCPLQAQQTIRLIVEKTEELRRES